MDRLVRRAVLERLAAVEQMAVRAGTSLPAPLARWHIQNITDGWRELLIQHQPDPTGRCPVCSGWLRRRRWPCNVWITAHRHLIGDNSDWLERARNTNPFCRPRQVLVVPRQVDESVVKQLAARNSPRLNGSSKASLRQP